LVYVPAALGAVQLSSMEMGIGGSARYDGGSPPEFQSYLWSSTAASDGFQNSVVVHGADARSGVMSEAFAGLESPPRQFHQIRAAGWAEAWSMPGRQASAETYLRASYAMTVSAWVDLETVGRGVIDVYVLSGGSKYNLAYHIDGDTSRRVFMSQGFWKIDAQVRIEDPVQEYGTFRFNIPTPGGSVLAALSGVLAFGTRRRR
jgi:hypothetical protein